MSPEDKSVMYTEIGVSLVVVYSSRVDSPQSGVSAESILPVCNVNINAPT
jgi:hypothetical protein